MCGTYTMAHEIQSNDTQTWTQPSVYRTSINKTSIRYYSSYNVYYVCCIVRGLDSQPTHDSDSSTCYYCATNFTKTHNISNKTITNIKWVKYFDHTLYTVICY